MNDNQKKKKLTIALSLLNLTGVRESMLQSMEQAVTAIHTALMTSVSKKEIAKFIKNAESKLDSLILDAAVMYTENFTLEELEAMEVFYASPAGKSILMKMPIITKASAAIGERWSKALEQGAQVLMS